MHRTEPSPFEPSPAMRVAGLEPSELVLQRRGRVGRELGVDAADRRAIPEDALLRQTQDGRGVGHRRPAGGPTDAADGIGVDLPQAASVAERDGTSNLPLFAAEYEDRAAQPGVVERHHLRADAAGLDVLDGGDGLVQPMRVVVAIVEHFGWVVLPGSVGGCVGPWHAGDIQHGPGRAVHGRSVYESLGDGGCASEHGWTWPLDGQRVCRATVANGEVRACLPSRPRDATGVACGLEVLLPVLQRGADSCVLGLPNAASGISRNDWSGDRGVVEMTHFSRKNLENQHVHIVRGQFSVRARPVRGLAGRYSPPSKKSSSVV